MKIVKENINFERGRDPKDAIFGPDYRMFSIIRHKILNDVKPIADEYKATIIDESDQEMLRVGVITPAKKGKILIELDREDISNPGSHKGLGVGYYLPGGRKTSGVGVSVGIFKEGLEKYEYEIKEALAILKKWLTQETVLKLSESLDFERGIDPKATMGIGVKEKIRQGILGLLQSSRGSTQISTINIGKNREDVWLEISDYGTKDFEDVFYSFLSPEYFKDDIYIKAKPKKFSKSWKNDWKVFIKDEYKDFFKACFDNEGYIKESLNFERGKNPYKAMKIGYIRPVNHLKKDYDQIAELVQTSKYIDFQTEFATEALDLIPDNNHFGWGNIHSNFRNMSREELYPFEQLVQKYTKLLGLDEPQR